MTERESFEPLGNLTKKKKTKEITNYIHKYSYIIPKEKETKKKNNYEEEKKTQR